MIIHDNISFHNCAELVPSSRGGLALARLPVAVIPALTRMGQQVAWTSDGIELRFSASLATAGSANLCFFSFANHGSISPHVTSCCCR